MNRRELVRAVAAHTGADPKAVDATVAGLTEVITAVVAKGEQVSIQGFAKFTKINRPARMARNPQTGEQVRVKAKTVAKATAMKAFRDTVMAPSKAPRLARGVWPTDPDLLSKQADARKAAAPPARKAAAPTARKAAAPPARKVVAKKAAATRTTAAKRATTVRTAKKTPAAKKVSAVRSTAKKAPARKAPARKAPAKSTVAKKAAAKRGPAKRTAARR